MIEAVFGVPVTNRYGCEEVSLIACEREEHRGLHVNSDSVLVEPSEHGQSALVTDLSNRAMPLIRYRIGDVAEGSARTCRCGRGLPMLERVSDGAAQVQTVQEAIDRLVIRLVPDERFTDTSYRQIDDLVEETFGGTIQFEVELVDAIPQEASGKFRFCISKVARERLEAMAV